MEEAAKRYFIQYLRNESTLQQLASELEDSLEEALRGSTATSLPERAAKNLNARVHRPKGIRKLSEEGDEAAVEELAKRKDLDKRAGKKAETNFTEGPSVSHAVINTERDTTLDEAGQNATAKVKKSLMSIFSVGKLARVSMLTKQAPKNLVLNLSAAALKSSYFLQLKEHRKAENARLIADGVEGSSAFRDYIKQDASFTCKGDEVADVTLSNGDQFRGTVLDGFLHNGLYVYGSTSHRYNGEFAMNQRNGVGTYQFHVTLHEVEASLAADPEAERIALMIEQHTADVLRETKARNKELDEQKLALSKVLARKQMKKKTVAAKIGETEKSRKEAAEFSREALQQAARFKMKQILEKKSEWVDLKDQLKSAEKVKDIQKQSDLISKFNSERTNVEKLALEEQRKQEAERQKRVEAKRRKTKGSSGEPNPFPDSSSSFMIESDNADALAQLRALTEGASESLRKAEEDHLSALVKSFEDQLKAEKVQRDQVFEEQQRVLKKALHRKMQKRSLQNEQKEKKKRELEEELEVQREAVKRAIEADIFKRENELKAQLENVKSEPEQERLFVQFQAERAAAQLRVEAEMQRQAQLLTKKKMQRKAKAKEPFAYLKGQWKNGLPDGACIYSDKEGNKYDGTWINGSAAGRGTFKFFDSCQYSGQFLDDVPHGKGEILLPNGDIYQGDWDEGKIQGKGVYTWKSGEKYDGMWRDNALDGEGIFVLAAGRRYMVRCERGRIVEEKELVPHGC